MQHNILFNANIFKRKKGKAEYSWLRFNAEDFNGQVVLATATWGAIHSYSTFLNTPTHTFWGHSEREKKNESGVQIISTGLTEEPIRKGTSDVRGFTCIPHQPTT